MANVAAMKSARSLKQMETLQKDEADRAADRPLMPKTKRELRNEKVDRWGDRYT